jgi:hypothetical protein
LTRLFSPIDEGILMNAELLRLASIGSGRRDHYAKKFFITTHAQACPRDAWTSLGQTLTSLPYRAGDKARRQSSLHWLFCNTIDHPLSERPSKPWLSDPPDRQHCPLLESPCIPSQRQTWQVSSFPIVKGFMQQISKFETSPL